MRQWLLGNNVDELKELLKTLGEPKYRADQIVNHIYRGLATSYDEMTSLSKSLRTKLEAAAGEFPLRLTETLVAKDETEKLLLSLSDGDSIEMALIPSPDRMTFCLSTQVGCPVGCHFCASGAAGLARNLTAAEMLAELLIGSSLHGALPDNVVFMGIGEGLLNTRELFHALEFMTAPEYFGMSPRRITVSTSGIVPGIDKLAALKREFTLAISLHAPDDATRAKLIPDTIRYPIVEIMAAADRYREQAGRMVTLEYTLLDGINDSPAAARAMATLAKRHHAKINLIPFNVAKEGFRRPSAEKIKRFCAELESTGAHFTLRRERGAESSAACGQLRLRRNNA